MNIRSKKRKGIALAAGAVLASFVIFGGCSMGTAADNSVSAMKPAQTVDVSGLSEARNTPVVRAAKAVGPAVVGITNKAVARDGGGRLRRDLSQRRLHRDKQSRD